MKSSVDSITLKLDKLNFYWRTRAGDPGNSPNEIPTFLPFEFTYNPKLKLIQQKHNPQVASALEAVYKKNENVGYLQEGHDLAKLYGDDFLEFIIPKLGDLKNLSILEVGCGGCYTLKRLKNLGANVKGCDPSPVSVKAGKDFGIEIIQDFYGPDTTSEKFDLIFHYDVLEHVYDPVGFLRYHRKNLKGGGRVLLAVPDCTPSIKNGDISMALHEHTNYFDLESLRETMVEAGFEPQALTASDRVGVLYCLASARDSSGKDPKREENKQDISKLERIKNNFNRALDSLNILLKEYKSVGIYIPLRAAPYLCHINDLGGVRFFDDNSELHGGKLDGFDIPIESAKDLEESPPEVVVVFSHTFGELIRERIKKVLPHLEVITLGELCRGEIPNEE